MVRGRLPGAVIGQQFRAGTSTPRDFPRYTGIVAKGLDLKLFRNEEIVRGSVLGETLTFSSTTYAANLSYTAIPDKQRSRLYTSDGRTVSLTRWSFQESNPGVSGYDQVLIDSNIYSSGETYLLDYIADDEDKLDDVPVDDLREVKALGDNGGQVRYLEGRDYRFVTSATGPTPGDDNANPDTYAVTAIVDGVANTGTGTVTHNSSTYTHDYNRTYVLEVTAAAGVTPNRTATVVVSVYPTSGGLNAAIGRSSTQVNTVEINLDEATPASLTNVAVEYGITLDFDFGGTHFVVNDTYSFSGNGPGALELDATLVNTNQYAEVSAVTTVATGDGVLTINPQSAYTGTVNRPYEVECTASAGTGPTRTASFRWRTLPDLLVLTGIATATNGSPTVTGTSTSFATEVAVGDLLFIGDDSEPVEVLSITNATTLVLTANYAPATDTNVKILRYRERTGTLTSVPITASTRLSLDSGILVDLDFGDPDSLSTENFDVGDVFSFTANVARRDYNGKENRDYSFSVTDVTTNDHQIVVAYSGSTALSGFGTHTFAEGNPLTLPNNVIVHARNLSLAQRYDASAPVDTFSLSLAFDGLIDWRLTRTETETIASTNVLRDLTGAITGTVGSYYVLTKKIPTEILYVSGPAPAYTNFAYNQVAGSTVVYFSADPGVNLTIRYRWAGIEPESGATYFMTGYTKRPASDYENPQLFFTRDAAADFLAPMTPGNDAAIANQIAWEQDELSLPGVVIFLVRDSDEDGVYTTADYDRAIDLSEEFKGLLDCVVVNQYSAREEFRDSVVNMNDPTVARRRIGYFGFPVDYPIGDEFTANTRVYAARQELQVFEESVARGSLAVIGNSYAKKTILVDSVGNQSTIGTVPTQVTLDGSFLAVALAARVASFNEPWQTVYNISVSGFDEIEPLTEREMIRLLDAGIIPIRVEGGSGFYIGTKTTDETEPSTSQLSGTVQRQYVLSRLQDVIDRRIIGFVADSPEEAAQRLAAEIIADLGSMVSTRKIAQYVDESTGTVRPINPAADVKAFRDSRDPTRMFFRASWYQKYPVLYVDGLVSVDAPIS